MSEGGHMRLPSIENKINWTTIIALIGMILTIGGSIYSYGRFTQRMDGNEASQGARNAGFEVRLTALELESRRIENLSYRMAQAEQSNIGLSQTLAEVSRLISAQGADIRVIREILDRSVPPAPRQ